MTDTKLSLLKDLNKKLPDSYIGELAKVSNQKEATQLARIFFTYQAIYDSDPQHPNKLSDCTISSIMTCLVVCAKTGLWPDPATNYIYFVPYANRAKPTISYLGLVKLMAANERVSLIYAEVVREGEKCDPETLKHERSFETLDNPIIGAYAVCKFTNGETLKCVMGKADLQKVEDCAKTKNVWNKWPGEMRKKAVLRRLAKMVLPQLRDEQPQLKAAIEAENKEYEGGRTIEQEPGSPDQLMDILEEKE